MKLKDKHRTGVVSHGKTFDKNTKTTDRKFACRGKCWRNLENIIISTWQINELK